MAEDIRLHPRVAYQGVLSEEGAATRVAAALPPLQRFRHDYCGAIAIVDWDHRLPSQNLILRVYGYYSDDTLEAGYEAFDDRLEMIAERDKYPEFDVPDFDGLAADEAYEIELSPTGTVGRCRLTSAWRRTVASRDAQSAVALVQTNDEYQRLVASSPSRPTYLGDLEAVSWTPAVRERPHALDARCLVPARVRWPHRFGPVVPGRPREQADRLGARLLGPHGLGANYAGSVRSCHVARRVCVANVLA